MKNFVVIYIFSICLQIPVLKTQDKKCKQMFFDDNQNFTSLRTIKKNGAGKAFSYSNPNGYVIKSIDCYIGEKLETAILGKLFLFEDGRTFIVIDSNNNFVLQNTLPDNFNIYSIKQLLLNPYLGYFSINEDKLTFLDELSKEFNNISSDGGTVNLEEGCKRDSELNSFISDSHPNWIFIEKKYIHHYTWVRQFATSFYTLCYFNLDGTCQEGPYSEGNCVLNSSFSLLYNLPRVSDPSGNFWHYDSSLLNIGNPINKLIGIENDYFYIPYNVGNNVYYSLPIGPEFPLYHRWDINTSDTSFYVGIQSTIENIPIGYDLIRTKAINDCGYDIDVGTNTWYDPNLLESLNQSYGISINALRASPVNSVVSNINYGIPSLIDVVDHPVFDNHTMSVYGYSKYKEIVFDLGFNQIEIYHYMFAVDSGHRDMNDYWQVSPTSDDYLMWIDVTSSFPTTFTTISRQSLSWPSC